MDVKALRRKQYGVQLEAFQSPKMSVTVFQSTHCNIPEGITLQLHHFEKLQSYAIKDRVLNGILTGSI